MDKKLEDLIGEFYEAYVENQIESLEIDAIKTHIHDRFENLPGDNRIETFKNKGLVVSKSEMSKYDAKEGIHEYLDDYGVLPLAVNLNGSSIGKSFNLDKAKVNFKKSVRIYPGRGGVIDKDAYTAKFQQEHNKDIDHLTETFKEVYSTSKLLNSKLEETKKKLLEFLEKEKVGSISGTPLGTIKVTESFDVDPFVLYDAINGRKELYLKEVNGRYDVIILPDMKKAILPKNFSLEGVELKDYYENEPLKKSSFIKKSEFNKLVKDGYTGFYFEIPMDPKEFFYSLPISRTKVLDLVDRGILDEDDVNEFYVKSPRLDADGEQIYSFTVLTEGVHEKRRDMFFDKLAEKSANQIDNKSEKVDINHSLVDIDFDDFSF